MATITTITGEGAFDRSIKDAINTNFANLNTAVGAPVSSSAPATASSAGTAGQIAYDSSHIYVCVATNTWVRASLASW